MALFLVIGLAVTSAFYYYPRSSTSIPDVPRDSRGEGLRPREPEVASPPTVFPSPNRELTSEEVGYIADELIKATGGKRTVSLTQMARRLSGFDPTGAKTRTTISLLERYLSVSPEAKLALTDDEFALLIIGLASRLYPGRTVSPDLIYAAIASSGLHALSSDQSDVGALDVPPIPTSMLRSRWTVAALVALPGMPVAWWLLGRRRRLKNYLRRRTPERSPLLHELVVRAPTEVAREQTVLARAALRLARGRQPSRVIDVEATVAATANNAGRPNVIFASVRASPEYLVIVATKGEDDHLARQLDLLAAELTAQDLSIVRYFASDDANLFF